jgi:hypothetical protein
MDDIDPGFNRPDDADEIAGGTGLPPILARGGGSNLSNCLGFLKRSCVYGPWVQRLYLCLLGTVPGTIACFS